VPLSPAASLLCMLSACVPAALASCWKVWFETCCRHGCMLITGTSMHWHEHEPRLRLASARVLASKSWPYLLPARLMMSFCKSDTVFEAVPGAAAALHLTIGRGDRAGCARDEAWVHPRSCIVLWMLLLGGRLEASGGARAVHCSQGSVQRWGSAPAKWDDSQARPEAAPPSFKTPKAGTVGSPCLPQLRMNSEQ
jgi:hypothetical protein